MPAIIIEINTTAGQQKVARLLKVVEPRTILGVIGERFRSFVDTQFKTKGEGKWAPLAWGTVALRKRGGSVPLQDTGRYKQSFVIETDNRTFVEVGSNLKVGSFSLPRIHEFGTGPYTIRVKRAKVLAAQLGQGAGGAGQVGLIATKRMTGWLFFGKEVHHPGVPARPVLPAKAVAERIIQTTVDGMLQRAAERGM